MTAMTTTPHLPIVGLPACMRPVGDHPFHVVGDKYVRAVSHGARALPVALPALGGFYDMTDLVSRLDGLLFTGSLSNVEPEHYAGPASAPGTLHDPARDATTLPLLQAAIAAGVPILGICRGFQELNVALGGTLHQQVQDLPGRMDHRAPKDQPPEIAYAPRHPVRLTPGGYLAGLAGTQEAMVNSLHAQGIDRLADGLIVEAVAPDGIIEGVRLRDAPAFAVAVQWHPEWRFWENDLSKALFAAFGAAVAARAAERFADRVGTDRQRDALKA